MAKQVAPQVAEAKPEAKDGRGRKEKEKYPGVEDGKILDAVPADFDFSKYAMLDKESFASQDLYWDFRANYAQYRADRFLADVDEFQHNASYFREHGKLPKSKRAIGRALKSKLADMMEIRSEIGDIEGVDLDALMSAVTKLANGK